jgi:hypothetical protein
MSTKNGAEAFHQALTLPARQRRRATWREAFAIYRPSSFVPTYLIEQKALDFGVAQLS